MIHEQPHVTNLTLFCSGGRNGDKNGENKKLEDDVVMNNLMLQF
jgi:hypothetical protein